MKAKTTKTTKAAKTESKAAKSASTVKLAPKAAKKAKQVPQGNRYAAPHQRGKQIKTLRDLENAVITGKSVVLPNMRFNAASFVWNWQASAVAELIRAGLYVYRK